MPTEEDMEKPLSRKKIATYLKDREENHKVVDGKEYTFVAHTGNATIDAANKYESPDDIRKRKYASHQKVRPVKHLKKAKKVRVEGGHTEPPSVMKLMRPSSVTKSTPAAKQVVLTHRPPINEPEEPTEEAKEIIATDDRFFTEVDE